jgi:hypothetical protein
MTTVGALTRQLSSLNIEYKQPTRSGHQKQPSRDNVAKLITKFAAPHVPSSPGPSSPPTLKTPTVVRPVGLSNAGRSANGVTSAAATSNNGLGKQLPGTVTSKPLMKPEMPPPPVPPHRVKDVVAPDIGKYDGGLESDDASKPTGNDDLAWDSSTFK